MLRRNTKNRLFYYLFDWANSPFSTVIITFIFSSYYVNVIAENKIQGTSYWGWTIALSGFVIAILGSFFGQLADKKKQTSNYFIIFSTMFVSVGCCCLWFCKPSSYILFSLTIIFLTNTFFELSLIFYNSKLLDFKNDVPLGRFSGTAWSIGYLGGIICLLIILLLLILPENNLLKLNKENYEHIRFCGIIVGLWYLLFSIPFMLSLKHEKNSKQKINFSELIYSLYTTIKEKNKFKFLLARMLYTDGLITLFSFGGIYASGHFNFSFYEIIYFGIALNISAALGAYVLGILEDLIGIKKILILSLVLLILNSFLILLIENKTLFWVLGITLGLFIGSIQSSSRTALIQISDKKNLNKMFGLYAVSGKVTNFLGPLFVASFTSYFESQKAGMSAILIFLIFGLLILRKTKI